MFDRAKNRKFYIDDKKNWAFDQVNFKSRHCANRLFSNIKYFLIILYYINNFDYNAKSVTRQSLSIPIVIKLNIYHKPEKNALF